MTLHDRLRYISNAVMNFKVFDSNGELDGASAVIGIGIVVLIGAIVGVIQ